MGNLLIDLYFYKQIYIFKIDCTQQLIYNIRCGFVNDRSNP
jgi:hypothetical protein